MSLRVMTFNIRYGTADDGPNRWERRRDLVVDAIREAAPDVCGLQEVLPFQLLELLDALPRYASVADGRYSGERGPHAPVLFDPGRCGVARRGVFWLSPTPDVPGSHGWDAAIPRLCTWVVLRDHDERIRTAVLNTHLDQKGERARREGADVIVERVRRIGEARVLLLGDMNARPGSEPLRRLTDAGLRDVYAEVHPTDEATTFHGFRGLRKLGRIDFVLCDESWRVEGAEILTGSVGGRYASDHFPVMADLSPG